MSKKSFYEAELLFIGDYEHFQHLCLFSVSLASLTFVCFSEQWHHCRFLHWTVFSLLSVFHTLVFLVFWFLSILCASLAQEQGAQKSLVFYSSFTRVGAWLWEEDLKMSSSQPVRDAAEHIFTCLWKQHVNNPKRL